MEILGIKGMEKDFKGLKVLHNVDMSVNQNGIFGLIGPNGSGKTTLLNIITGFLRPTAGEVIYKGRSITSLKPHEVAQRRIARTFQLSSLYPNLTVEDNIITGSHLKASSSLLGSFFQTRRYVEEDRMLKEKARKILSFMDMEKQRHMLAKNLPFGDERKLEIAIALATDPELLLMDEPAAGMNPEEQARLINLIQLMAQMGITMIIIEHNMRVIMKVCTSIAVLSYGIKVAEGTPEEIAHNEKVISVYLGERRLG
jgi:branched-chain amino acid transport system ATP-binding protein